MSTVGTEERIYLEGLAKVVQHLSHYAVRMDGKIKEYRTKAILSMEPDLYVKKWGDAIPGISLNSQSVKDVRTLLSYYTGEDIWTHKTVLDCLPHELKMIKQEKTYQGLSPQAAAYFLPTSVAMGVYPMLSILHILKNDPGKHFEWSVSPPFLADVRLEGLTKPIIGFHDERLRAEKGKELVQEGWDRNTGVYGRQAFVYREKKHWRELQSYIILQEEASNVMRVISTADRMNDLKECLVWKSNGKKCQIFRKLYGF